MKWLKRILGICKTKLPLNEGAWNYQAGQLEISLEKTPELARVGGAVRLEGHGLPKRVLVVHGEDGQFRAYENRCTHAGHRRLDPVMGETKVRCCSVGQSTFDCSGNHLSGPAPESIRALVLSQNEGKLSVTLN